MAIFCDLRKAFDTVDHVILISKLQRMGVRGVELQWFKNYLADRKQIVHVNGSNSLLLNISLGVPQGSILGPLLFLIYINDLPLCSHLLALLFADDTTLIMSDPDLDSLIAKVNVEFKKVSDFFRSHKMALHPDKTKFILFTNSNEARSKNIEILLNFNNDNCVPSLDLIKHLERVTSESTVPAIKFLGIYIDPHLNFKFHINMLNSKVSKSMYFLRAVKNVLTQPALKSVYYALVHSYFIYGIQIWSCTSPSNINSLVLKQKMAIRTICGAKYNSHTEPLFKNSNILPFKMLVDYFNIQFLHRYTINLLPKSFQGMWVKNSERLQNENEPRMNLRNNEDFFIPNTRLTSTDKFPLSNLPMLWHNFPDNSIKAISSPNVFNTTLKQFYINKLTINYVCGRLLCPHCHLNA